MVNQKRFLLMLITLLVFKYSLAGFIETPSSITTEYESGVDRTVVFRCRHEELLTSVDWKLNGISSLAYTDVVDYFIRENGIRVNTLTVPVIPTYNGTEIVCSTTVNGVTEETPAALLTITGSSSTPSVETTTAVTTPSSTTTTVGTPSTGVFDEPPSPLTMAVEEGVATFYCQHSACNSIDWRVNGTFFNRITSPNISRGEHQVDAGARIYSISIATSLEYNMSRVECVAYFSSGPPLTSPVVMLLIQDVPGRVKNASCKRNHTSGAYLITNWDPLPSLDLTNADPGIVYRVQWRNVTCGQNVSMGEETVNGTNTSYAIHHPHEIYEVTITPRNNIMAARDGERRVMREKFRSVEPHLVNLSRKLPTVFKDNSPVPSYYTMLLKSLDGTQSDSTVTINVQREGESVELRLERQLPSKKLWNVSVLAHNCEVDTVLEGFELSTHDVQNVSVSSPHPGEIRVTGDFFEGSNATAALLVVYSTSNNNSELDTTYHVVSGPGGNIDVTMRMSNGGDYEISVFTLENGRPFPRVVAFPRPVYVHVAMDSSYELEELHQRSLINYEVQSTSTGVCITCTFLESSTTDCVAVVHQQISQLNSSGLMNIESSHKFTRSGDTASGCIEGVNLEDYQVGVIGGIDEPLAGHRDVHSPWCSTITCYSFCAAVGALSVISLVCGITVSICFANKKRMQQREDNEGAIEENVTTKRNEAYEITVLARQRVIMDRNPAYEQV